MSQVHKPLIGVVPLVDYQRDPLRYRCEMIYNEGFALKLPLGMYPQTPIIKM